METANSLTAAGMAMGTPYYISPEQIRALSDIDGRSDRAFCFEGGRQGDFERGRIFF